LEVDVSATLGFYLSENVIKTAVNPALFLH
jgi:hypothetical protein